MSIEHISGYKFISLTELPALQAKLRAKSAELSLKGTILLSEEGINIMLAGIPVAIAAFQTFLRTDARFADITYKKNDCSMLPFKRLFVKIKKEIITMGVPAICPIDKAAPQISAQQLKSWLDAQQECVLLDTRNNYEVTHGTFNDAVHLDIAHFRHFPQAIKQLPEHLKQKPIVTYCTGGIRCEKAALLLLEQGFEQVYQLKGGILQYFAECGDAHYHGECFVFDERGAVNAKLEPVKSV